jgi:Putative sensor
MTSLDRDRMVCPCKPGTHEVLGPSRSSAVRAVFLNSGYSLSAPFVALPAFVIVVTALTVGLGLVVLVGGLLLIWVAVMVARGFAQLERTRLSAMLGKTVGPPTYPT